MKPIHPSHAPLLVAAVSAAVLTLAAVTPAHAAYEYRIPLKGLRVQSPEVLSFTLASATLPEAIVGAPYAPYDFKSLLTMSGGNAPALTALSWSAPGALPAGLSLSATGLLSGTPMVKNEAGAPVPVQVTYETTSGQRTYTLPVIDPQVSLGATTLPAGTVGQAYTYDFKSLLGVAGDPNYNVSLATFSTSGALPPGLALAADGQFSGTLTAKNTTGSNFQVIATYKTKKGQQAYTLVVNGVTLQVTQIAAGYYHTCAVTTTGGAKCWGDNSYGELGDNSMTPRLTPVDVQGLTSGVASIGGGSYHTCAVTTTGGAKCWGYNNNGQLGDNSTTNRWTPVNVQGLTAGVASIAVGDSHTCAVTTAGGAKCWGYNGFGQLGDDSTTNRWAPVNVSELTSGVAAIAGGSHHTCAVTTTGGAKCWGRNDFGQLGDNSTTRRLTPVDVQGLTSGVAAIGEGAYHTCSVSTAGGARCWGRNDFSQLGDGTTTQRLTPVEVLP